MTNVTVERVFVRTSLDGDITVLLRVWAPGVPGECQTSLRRKSPGSYGVITVLLVRTWVSSQLLVRYVSGRVRFVQSR